MFLIIITCIFIYKGLKFFVKLRHYFKDILNNYYTIPMISSLIDGTMGIININLNNNYYNKTYIDTLSGTVYTNTLNITTLSNQLNNDYYTQTYINANYYNTSEIQDNFYTKTEVYNVT